MTPAAAIIDVEFAEIFRRSAQGLLPRRSVIRVHGGPLLVLTRLLAKRLATTLTHCTGRPRPRRISRPEFLLEPQRSA